MLVLVLLLLAIGDLILLVVAFITVELQTLELKPGERHAKGFEIALAELVDVQRKVRGDQASREPFVLWDTPLLTDLAIELQVPLLDELAGIHLRVLGVDAGPENPGVRASGIDGPVH